MGPNRLIIQLFLGILIMAMHPGWVLTKMRGPNSIYLILVILIMAMHPRWILNEMGGPNYLSICRYPDHGYVSWMGPNYLFNYF